MKKFVVGFLCLLILSGCQLSGDLSIVNEGPKDDKTQIEDLLVSSFEVKEGGEYSMIFKSIVLDKASGWFRNGNEKSGWDVWVTEKTEDTWSLVATGEHEYLPRESIEPLADWVEVVDVCYRDSGSRLELWDEVEYPGVEEVVLEKYGNQIMLALGNVYGYGNYAAGSFNYSGGAGEEADWRYFAVTREDGEWQVVADSDSEAVRCDDVSEYNFPSDVLRRCLDKDGSEVKRDFMTDEGAKIKQALMKEFDTVGEDDGYDQISQMGSGFALGWIGQTGTQDYRNWLAQDNGENWKIIFEENEGRVFNCDDVESELVPLDLLPNCFDDYYNQPMHRSLNRNESEVLPDSRVDEFIDQLNSDVDLGEYDQRQMEYFWNGTYDQISPVLQAVSLRWSKIARGENNYYGLLESYLIEKGFEFKNIGQATVAGSVMYQKDDLACTVWFGPTLGSDVMSPDYTNDYELVCGVL
ncbi:hypothetical protein KJ855_04450 [Patescibacteria group bacterium]|nr:hypothetical protein [Patescibacteria group bacterium]